MMFEGKHIHYSAVDNKPLCSYSGKLCKQRRLSGYAFCIRHILEDKTSPFKQCAHVAKYNNQKCTNPIPCDEDREFCNSHMQVAGMLPKKERKNKKEKEKDLSPPSDGRLKFADRLRALLRKEGCALTQGEKVDEDPYAFPDPVTENNLSCHSRTVWNCVQKTFDSINADSPLKQDQTHPSKTNAANDGKGKSHVSRLSKTMNRLQAKIAQNKLLDKLKKSQESSHQTVVPSLIKHERVTIPSINGSHKRHELLDVGARSKKAAHPSREPAVANGVKPVVREQCHLPVRPAANVQLKWVEAESPSESPSRFEVVGKDLAFLQEHKKVKNSVVCETKKRPVTRDSPQIKKEFQLRATKEMLQRAQNICRRKKKCSYDGYYFGFVDSDCEESEEEDECQAFLKLNWCCSLLREAFLWNQTIFESRMAKNSFLKSELRRYGYLTHKILSVDKPVLSRLQKVDESLNKTNGWHPKYTAQVTLLEKLSSSRTEKQKKLAFGQLEKQHCCYQMEGVKCDGFALPYTSHCLSHIMYNVDQLLYEHCTAKFADNTQCCVPVFDICHELPLCPEHAKKRDNYNKMASEPKPKKARKKTKPSALTRPAKRGKKKKRPQNILRPTSLPSSPLDNCANENTSDSITLEARTGTLSTTVDEAVEENMESEMGSELEDNFSPDSIEKSLELPLDTVELANQATKLLEEHDFTEVLNKIPDNAFSDLFTDGRNGEYIPSKEETEELERALAAVSKDVHLAKESLAKLTVTRQDLEDLSNSIDLSGGLLAAENLSSSLDENTLREFAQGNIDGLNVITGLSSSDLTSLTQALSSLPPDSLASHVMTPSTMMTSHLTNGDSAECLMSQEVGFGLGGGGQFLDNSSSGCYGSPHATACGDIVISSLLLSSSASTDASSAYQTSRSSNRIDDGSSVAGSCTSSQWLLNPSLALSQLGYHNGFQGGSPQLLSSLSKFPLQALSAEVSLISHHHHNSAAASIYEDMLKDSVQTLGGLRQGSQPVAVQETKTTILAQEGGS